MDKESRKFRLRIDSAKALAHAGEIARARARVSELSRGRVPRGCLLELSRLATRLWLPEVTVRLLRPRVRDAIDSRLPGVTYEDVAEYGSALSSLGLGDEAVQLFESMPRPFATRFVPAFLLAYAEQWNWEALVPSLEGYLIRPGLEPLQRAWGLLAYGGAMVHGTRDFPLAESTLATVRRISEDTGFVQPGLVARLTIAELRAEQGDWKLADRLLKDLLGDLRGFGDETNLMLHLEVRLSETALRLGRDRRRALRRHQALKQRMADRKRWDLARICDFAEARVTGDEQLWARLYHGTPFEPARRKFLRHMPNGRPPAHYDWPVGGRGAGPGAGPGVLLEVESSGPGSRRLCQRTLVALCRDVYQPPDIHQLFSRLYPGEVFASPSGAAKVRQALHRLRRRLAEERVPLRIEVRDDRYVLASSRAGGVQLRIRAETAAGGTEALREKATREFGPGPFSAREFAAALAVPTRTAQRLIAEGVADGSFAVIGSARATRYRIRAPQR